MRNIYYLLISAALCLTSCSVETDVDAGGTATEAVAGNWDVQVDVMQVDESGDTIHYGDYYGFGTFTLYTFNTAANRADSIWIDDFGNFWSVKAKVGCDISKRTISATNATNVRSTSEPETCSVTGKILPGAGVNLHGKPTDSICVDFVFSSDSETIYRYSGTRYSGFYE